MNKILRKYGGLAIGTLGVFYYKSLPSKWNILIWLPIHIGFYLFYHNFEEDEGDRNGIYNSKSRK